MRGLVRRGVVRSGGARAALGGALTVALLVAEVAASQAAGALAIGACAAYGYAYDFKDVAAAGAAAKLKCGDSCKQVVTTRKGCVAFAVDGRKPCGPNGFANGDKLGTAQNTALKYCYKYGGRDCVIRAWICDAKG